MIPNCRWVVGRLGWGCGLEEEEGEVVVEESGGGGGGGGGMGRGRYRDEAS